MTILFALLAYSDSDRFFSPLRPVDFFVRDWERDAALSLLISSAIVIYTTPQLLLALGFGWLSCRYRVVIRPFSVEIGRRGFSKPNRDVT
jgi:hypothetical protein